MSFISNAVGGSNGYNVTAGLPAGMQAVNQTANLQNMITGGQTAYGTANQGLNQLAQMLTQQAQGQGPNLANQQLQNFTGQNVANQAALMAGQRGAASNPGLIARQAAQIGSGAQQQAAGQASQNVLAQQLAAQQQLGGVYGTQGQLANQFSGMGLNALGQQNQMVTNANLGASSANANIAGQNASTNMGMFGGAMNALGGGLSSMMSSPSGMSAANAGMSGAGNQFSSMLEPGGSYSTSDMFSPGSSGGGTMLAAEGGEIDPLRAKLPKKMSNIPTHLQHIARIRYPHLANGGKVEDKVPVKVSPGEAILPPNKTDSKNPLKDAMKVPGKPKHPGDDYRNDTVKKDIKKHSIVLPNSITNHPNAPQLAYDFVSRIKAGHHKPKAKGK